MNGTRAQRRLHTVTDPLQVLCRTRILNAAPSPSYFTRQRSDTSLIPHESVSGPWRRNFSFINIQPQLFEHNAESSYSNGCVIFLFFPGREISASQHRTRAAAPACCALTDGYSRPSKGRPQDARDTDGRRARKTCAGQARAGSW